MINHFSPTWNVCICMLVEYFSGSKSIPRAKSKQIARLVWWRNEYQLIYPTPPIIANLCENIYTNKLDDKTYRRSETFIRLLSLLISLRNFSICGWTLNLNESIYEITHDVFQHQQIDSCFKSLFRLITKKTSRHRISGILWGESTSDWIAVLPKHHSLLHLTQFRIQMDIYELIHSRLLTAIQIWGVAYITSQWRYVRDMASQITGNSTVVFRLNNGDIKAQHHWSFVRGIHRYLIILIIIIIFIIITSIIIFIIIITIIITIIIIIFNYHHYYHNFQLLSLLLLSLLWVFVIMIIIIIIIITIIIIIVVVLAVVVIISIIIISIMPLLLSLLSL